ncbi:unnamed protein product [Polarella glacialis]|uniref:Uncharacterized protein n=1 Tax=Polarella glacialis TaxID=89957 RepID=A0A813L624_POLGL|nr:unnamed protein product [Polarella glacialis]
MLLLLLLFVVVVVVVFVVFNVVVAVLAVLGMFFLLAFVILFVCVFVCFEVSFVAVNLGLVVVTVPWYFHKHRFIAVLVIACLSVLFVVCIFGCCKATHVGSCFSVVDLYSICVCIQLLLFLLF